MLASQVSAPTLVDEIGRSSQQELALEKTVQLTRAEHEVAPLIRREHTSENTSQPLRRGYAARLVSQHIRDEYVAHETDQARPTISRQRPLLASRLYPPPLQATLILRERLLTLLDASLAHRLTLLLAPAGFGKTTLLVQWFVRHKQQVAWLSLDNEHNDPQRFLVYVIGSLQRVYPDLGRSILASVQVETGHTDTRAQELAALEERIVLLLNELTALPLEVTLILDNYHLIENQCIHDALKLLLAQLPAHVHLIIATRNEPPGLLARLRASGQLMELGTNALRLTREEQEELLTHVLHLEPEPEGMTALEECVEGWPAGFYLARSAAQDQTEFASFLAACAGNNRHIQTYFLEEVLTALSPSAQTFLLRTSLLGCCDSSLCAAVTDQENAAGMLEELARARVFLSPLVEQEGWYRYHPLFASALRHHLRHTQPELAATLHLRASWWFETHALFVEAIEHALAAQE
ncbi:MAG: hypothetical protein ACRDHW_09745, partial [Ktedonobacteraceae bacterium]